MRVQLVRVTPGGARTATTAAASMAPAPAPRGCAVSAGLSASGFCYFCFVVFIVTEQAQGKYILINREKSLHSCKECWNEWPKVWLINLICSEGAVGGSCISAHNNGGSLRAQKTETKSLPSAATVKIVWGQKKSPVGSFCQAFTLNQNLAKLPSILPEGHWNATHYSWGHKLQPLLWEGMHQLNTSCLTYWLIFP